MCRILRMRLLAQFVPVRLLDMDPVMLCGFLNIGKRQITIGVGYAFDLIKPRQSILDMRGIGQRLLPLLWEGLDTIRQFFPILRI